MSNPNLNASPPPVRGMTALEVARELGVSDWLIYKCVKAGTIRGTWLGGRLVIPSSEVTRVLGGTVEPERVGPTAA